MSEDVSLVEVFSSTNPLGPFTTPYCSEPNAIPELTIYFCDPVDDSGLVPGTNYLASRVTNSAGAVSAFSTPIVMTLVSRPLIQSPTDNSYTNDPTPTLSGVADADYFSNVHVGDGDEGQFLLCNAAVQPDNSWQCTSTPLADGVRTVRRGHPGPHQHEPGDVHRRHIDPGAAHRQPGVDHRHNTDTHRHRRDGRGDLDLRRRRLGRLHLAGRPRQRGRHLGVHARRAAPRRHPRDRRAAGGSRRQREPDRTDDADPRHHPDDHPDRAAAPPCRRRRRQLRHPLRPRHRSCCSSSRGPLAARATSTRQETPSPSPAADFRWARSRMRRSTRRPSSSALRWSDATGSFEIAAVIPEDIEPGNHTFVVTVTADGAVPSVIEQPVTVVAPDELKATVPKSEGGEKLFDTPGADAGEGGTADRNSPGYPQLVDDRARHPARHHRQPRRDRERRRDRSRPPAVRRDPGRVAERDPVRAVRPASRSDCRASGRRRAGGPRSSRCSVRRPWSAPS